MSIKVSVIIPVYNSEKYITQCIESLLDQTLDDCEFIFINDGSEDKSLLMIEKYKVLDPRIKLINQENQGVSMARNNGLQEASGEYVGFVDADDTVDKQYFEFLLNELLSSSSDLVCCGYKDISEYGEINIIDFNFDYLNSSHSFMELVCRGTGGVLWGKIFKKDVIDKYNLKMDKDIFMCEDLIFVLRYASYCKSFSALKMHLYNYNRLNQSSISANISLEYLQNYIKVWRYMNEIFDYCKFDKLKKNELILLKIQQVILRLVEQQSININELGMKNAVNNVQNIMNIEYIKTYKNQFSTNIYLYKPYIYLMKKNFIKTTILYGIGLNFLRGLKKK